ncbi:YgiT-type zinc finger protein [Paenibacillus sp. DR312]|uniref:YgiT-type zinc finger protein n=1 Tax=unclassified Paenibacillus TaxID=185978 RepID=UPI001C96282E|nr:YgiT-type zinc finger protein [Paenibacillus sp. DR312]
MTLRTRCLCGSQAQLQYKNERGRIRDKVVRIRNVPVIYCEDCQESFMTGLVSLSFAERVKRAVELGVNELEF